MSQFYVVRNGKQPGLYLTWDECKSQIHGFSGAVFKKFQNLKEAEEYLMAEPELLPKKKKPKIEYEEVKFEEKPIDPTSIYTDGGHNAMTGKDAWGWVTNNKGTCILNKYIGLLSDMNLIERSLPVGQRWCIVAQFADVKAQQNNGAELLALLAGLRIACTTPEIKTIYSDSQLLIKYWTKGYFKREKMDPKKIEFIHQTVVLRKQFEAKGGQLVKISGKDNPSDGGFHK
jgi:ribonuclease H-related protein